MPETFTLFDIAVTGLLFMWAGFVRSGLGFGGAVLGLPLMLFVYDKPLYWLPIIGTHLLFFSAMTLRTRLHNVDWGYLLNAGTLIIPGAIIGVLGLLSLPNNLLVVFIYSISLFYALLWLLDLKLRSNNKWLDGFYLVTGGYVAGTALTGAPLIVAVFMRNVALDQLRNTLFVLWFVLVTIKMIMFASVGVELHTLTALALLPVAAIGHIAGLKAHEYILRNDRLFKKSVGGALLVVSILGLAKLGLG